MISGHASIADAVEATRRSLRFPGKAAERECCSLYGMRKTDQTRRREPQAEGTGGWRALIGSSDAFERVLEQATLAARSDARVLLTGESGTGKELLAAHIHAESPFSNGPFVKVNCAAIPNDLIESEHRCLSGAMTGGPGAPGGLRRGYFGMIRETLTPVGPSVTYSTSGRPPRAARQGGRAPRPAGRPRPASCSG
jgi:DNA-binding NtrC family response regulator